MSGITTFGLIIYVMYIPDTDTDFSESEGLSSLQISAPAKLGIRQTEQSGSYFESKKKIIKEKLIFYHFSHFRTPSSPNRNQTSA